MPTISVRKDENNIKKNKNKYKKEVTAKFILPRFVSLVCIMSPCFHLVTK